MIHSQATWKTCLLVWAVSALHLQLLHLWLLRSVAITLKSNRQVCSRHLHQSQLLRHLSLRSLSHNQSLQLTLLLACRHPNRHSLCSPQPGKRTCSHLANQLKRSLRHQAIPSPLFSTISSSQHPRPPHQLRIYPDGATQTSSSHPRHRPLRLNSNRCRQVGSLP